MVRRVLDLVRLRNTHRAFDGDLRVDGDDHSLRLRWEREGDVLALEVDFDDGTAFLTDGSRVQPVARWATSLGTKVV